MAAVGAKLAGAGEATKGAILSSRVGDRGGVKCRSRAFVAALLMWRVGSLE